MVKRETVRSHRGDRTWRLRILSWLLVPAVGALCRIRVENPENLPRSGPVIVAANHMTELDPIIVAIAVWRGRRSPHFMAKDSLFRIPVVGSVLGWSGQIPVERRAGGGKAMRAALDILRGDGVVIMYPEATLTRDPDLWPMAGKTGVVRLARETGAPILPTAHWGVQNVLGRYEKRLHWWPPTRRVTVRFGAPLDLAGALGTGPDSEQLQRATDAVMVAVTSEMESIRGPKPSSELWTKTSAPRSTLTPRGITAEAAERSGGARR